MSKVSAPTLLIVGQRDEPIRAASTEIFGRFAGPHRLVVVEGGDHLFDDPDALRSATAHTVAWFRRHLG